MRETVEKRDGGNERRRQRDIQSRKYPARTCPRIYGRCQLKKRGEKGEEQEEEKKEEDAILVLGAPYMFIDASMHFLMRV